MGYEALRDEMTFAFSLVHVLMSHWEWFFAVEAVLSYAIQFIAEDAGRGSFLSMLHADEPGRL